MYETPIVETTPTEELPEKRQGFAAMTAERRREIASMGGKAAHRQGTAHKFSSELARTAGHKGGVAVSRDLDYMVDIGRRGGRARIRNIRERAARSGS